VGLYLLATGATQERCTKELEVYLGKCARISLNIVVVCTEKGQNLSLFAIRLVINVLIVGQLYQQQPTSLQMGCSRSVVKHADS